MRQGIKANSRIVFVSGCRVYKDMRKTPVIEDTRSEINMKAEDRPWRKRMWEIRENEKASARAQAEWDQEIAA